jgi:hypothetical protein
MMTCTHQRQRYPEGSETAHDGGWVNLSAHTRQDEREHAGRRYAKGGRGTARRERRCWGVRLLVALVLLSVSGAGTFGATLPPPADLGMPIAA